MTCLRLFLVQTTLINVYALLATKEEELGFRKPLMSGQSHLFVMLVQENASLLKEEGENFLFLPSQDTNHPTKLGRARSPVRQGAGESHGSCCTLGTCKQSEAVGGGRDCNPSSLSFYWKELAQK